MQVQVFFPLSIYWSEVKFNFCKFFIVSFNFILYYIWEVNRPDARGKARLISGFCEGMHGEGDDDTPSERTITTIKASFVLESAF